MRPEGGGPGALLARALRAGPAGVADLTGAPAGDVLDLLALLAGTGGFVLHGTNHRPPPDRLLPQQAFDAARASGRRAAVYATTDWVEALLNALLDREALGARLGPFAFGFAREGPRHAVTAEPHVLRALREDPRAWSPGTVFVLPRAGFVPSAGSDTEWSSPAPVRPAARFRVPASLSRVVLGEGSPLAAQ